MASGQNLSKKAQPTLNERQAAFVREFIIDLNATQAATRCGYSERTARQQGARLLSHAAVREEIEKAKAERFKRTEISQDYVLTKIRDTIERCSQAEPVLDKDGKPTGEYKFEPNSVLKGLELLGRHLGTWNDKIKLQGDADNPLIGFFNDLQGTGLRVKR